MKSKTITGLSKLYEHEPIDVCESLNKHVRDSNYYCIIDAEEEGYYLVRINWAIENDFLYRIYF